MVHVISVDDHRDAVAELLDVGAPVRLPLADCAGLVLAEDLVATVALPSFDNSAMDGYAVRAADTVGASAENPVELPVGGDIPAGRTDIPELSAASTYRIMTGAPMPPGADSIVKVEDTDAGTQRVRVRAPASEGAHLRRAGEDVASGAVALSKGSVLSPAHLGLAAAVGVAQLPVHAPPRVLVVSTGSELVEPPQPLRYGQIYESNGIMLAAAMRAIGAQVQLLRSVDDDVATFRATIEPRLAECDLLVTSGGVSAGAYEVVKDALGEVGVRFSKVGMQPGGPQGHGRWNRVPVVAFPGNPVSVLVSYEVFLRPALLRALGHTTVQRPTTKARLSESLRSPAGRRQFRRGWYTPPDVSDNKGDVTGVVGPRGGPGSHLLAAFTEANCLIELPEDVGDVAEGSVVDVVLLEEGHQRG